MIATGIPLYYGLYQIMLWDNAEAEKLIKQYCPQGLDDPKNPCGLTRDSVVTPLIAMTVVLHAIIFLGCLMHETPEKKEKKNNEM